MRPAALLLVASAVCQPALAQQLPADPEEDAVVVTTLKDPVAKSYRRIVSGMDLFEKKKAMAPGAELRFRLLPRKRNTDMDGIRLEVQGRDSAVRVPVAADRTFTLERSRKALDEDAQVSPNRRRQSMTWRADIRSPGLPPNVRRLGDLRLECQVGMQAGLISNERPLIGAIADLFAGGSDYCERAENNRYLFFADRPIWNVMLVNGSRREDLPIERLYAGASYNADFKADLAYCDCEVLVDRSYTLPLGDKSWPDDTRVELEYMDDAPR